MKTRFIKCVGYLLVLCFFLALAACFNKVDSHTIFPLNGEDIYFINQTRSYYSNKVAGRVFENKLTKTVYKFQEYLFEKFEINLLLFAGFCFGVKIVLKISRREDFF